MNGSEKGLQAVSLVAIVILSAVVMDLLSEPEEDPEIVYVLVDNRIIIDENATVEELSRDDVARVASFNIKVFGDTKMSNSTVVDELVDLFQSYDLVAVQEIKDIDEEVPFLFLDELNDIDEKAMSSIKPFFGTWSSLNGVACRKTTKTLRSSTLTTTSQPCSPHR